MKLVVFEIKSWRIVVDTERNTASVEGSHQDSMGDRIWVVNGVSAREREDVMVQALVHWAKLQRGIQ